MARTNNTYSKEQWKAASNFGLRPEDYAELNEVQAELNKKDTYADNSGVASRSTMETNYTNDIEDQEQYNNGHDSDIDFNKLYDYADNKYQDLDKETVMKFIGMLAAKQAAKSAFEHFTGATIHPAIGASLLGYSTLKQAKKYHNSITPIQQAAKESVDNAMPLGKFEKGEWIYPDKDQLRTLRKSLEALPAHVDGRQQDEEQRDLAAKYAAMGSPNLTGNFISRYRDQIMDRLKYLMLVGANNKERG